MARGVAKDHDAKRGALRKGAATYFADHGFDRASMMGAARACGVSKALIYHYWDSKEALLFDILDTHLSELVEAVDAAKAGGLEALIRAILLAYADADAEHKLQLEVLGVLPAKRQEPLIKMQRHLVVVMSEALAQERPALDEDRLRAVAMSVFGILNWYYMWHRPGRGMSREDYAEMIGKFVMGGLKTL